RIVSSTQERTALNICGFLNCPDHARRIAGRDHASRYVMCHYAPSADHAPAADGHPLQNKALHAYKHIIPNDDRRCGSPSGIVLPQFLIQGMEVRITDDGVSSNGDTVPDGNTL